MQVFNPEDSEHTLIIIPRITNFSNVYLTIRHELTDISSTFILNTFSFDNGYLNIIFEYNFKEGASYAIEVKYLSKLIYRGKAYATSTTNLENYKLIP